MTIAAPPSGLQPEDYEEIEAAVMETARGRWFLCEYARRQRAVETEGLRAAIARVEERLDALGAPPCPEAVPIVERLSELAWTLRERGVEDYVCAKIEALTREIAGAKLPIWASEPATASEPLVGASETANEGAERIALQAQASAKEKKATAEAPADPRLAALLWLDRLPLLDRMALFI